jgi:hypothetical protein
MRKLIYLTSILLSSNQGLKKYHLEKCCGNMDVRLCNRLARRQVTVESALLQLYICRIVVSTWDTSGSWRM